MPEQETLTVGELINQLSNCNPLMPVKIYGIGITAATSWECPLTLEKDTVDERNGTVHINISIHG